jgi:hypothetical protein
MNRKVHSLLSLFVDEGKYFARLQAVILVSLYVGIWEIEAPLVKWRSLNLFKVCVAYGETRVTRAAIPYQLSNTIKPRQVLILQTPILISMDDYSDSDTSSEPEYQSDQESALGSDGDTDDENLELELSKPIHEDDEFDYSPSNIEAQLQAQHNATLFSSIAC